MPKILISNDDGVEAQGIKTLAKKMKSIGDVTVVAPDRERSTASHSLTLFRPLRINKIRRNFYTVDGTPSDCVNLGVNWITKNNPPDIIISGINHGANLADDLTYSGTAAGAMEGTLLGIPSIAISLVGEVNLKKNFEVAANFAAKLARKVLKNGLPKDTFLNVNVPSYNGGKAYGCGFTAMGKRYYSQDVEEKIDPRGKKYYWIGGIGAGFSNKIDTDCYAVSRGKISITPIKLDLTNYTYLRKMLDWNL